MKLVHIFESSILEEGLWAVRYDNDSTNTFELLFDKWRDVEWMRNFCRQNYSDILNISNGNNDLEAFVLQLMDEADEIERILLDACFSSDRQLGLQTIFKPLSNSDTSLMVLQPSKASVKRGKIFKIPKLRIYALRLDSNTYVITGGAIKLTQTMAEREHTTEELNKVKLVRDWLKGEGIEFPEDLKALK